MKGEKKIGEQKKGMAEEEGCDRWKFGEQTAAAATRSRSLDAAN